MLTQLRGLVLKDLKVFATDRRAMIMGFIAPIAIASFFGSVFTGAGNREAAKIPVAIVDLDRSAVSHAVLQGAASDPSLAVTSLDPAAARDNVRTGRTTVAVIIPQGFGDAAGQSLFAGQNRPELQVLYDPSHAAEMAMVRGILTQHVMEAVTREMFSGPQGVQMIDAALERLQEMGLSPQDERLLRELLRSARQLNLDSATAGSPGRGFTLPYTVREQAVTSGEQVAYNYYAHAFAGMGIQFLLFAAIDLGTGILLERERGIWKRLRSAPIGRTTLLAARTISATMIALLSLLVAFGFAIVVFGVRIQGSVPGFIAVAVASALMCATFGLLIATVGRTPSATRAVAILVVLLMVMLGGAWVPSFLFPAWVQQLTVIIPARWAVDGLDAMTWRGLPLSAAVTPTLMLLLFSLIFATAAVRRFRWV